MNLLEDDSCGAIFSECGGFRYVLWRIWNKDKPIVMYIGLNPSTANANKNDNTIIKLCKVSVYNGFGGFYMLNLFSLVSPYPKDLKSCVDPVMDNDKYLIEFGNKAQQIVFAWGNFKEAEQRANQVKEMFSNTYCFVKNKNGTPKHPLYCEDKSVLIPFKNN